MARKKKAFNYILNNELFKKRVAETSFPMSGFYVDYDFRNWDSFHINGNYFSNEELNVLINILKKHNFLPENAKVFFFTEKQKEGIGHNWINISSLIEKLSKIDTGMDLTYFIGPNKGFKCEEHQSFLASIPMNIWANSTMTYAN